MSRKQEVQRVLNLLVFDSFHIAALYTRTLVYTHRAIEIQALFDP